MLALNNANAPHVSTIDAAELRGLIDEAFHVGVRGDGNDGFLIALDQDASYGSPNFAWFKARLARFVYVDRIVIASSSRGRGLGRALYEELFHISRQAGHSVVTCEVNFDPPNPVSDRFHGLLGFEEMGRAWVESQVKTVRYLTKALTI
jgi:uncharacterized protein